MTSLPPSSPSPSPSPPLPSPPPLASAGSSRLSLTHRFGRTPTLLISSPFPSPSPSPSPSNDPSSSSSTPSYTSSSSSSSSTSTSTSTSTSLSSTLSSSPSFSFATSTSSASSVSSTPTSVHRQLPPQLRRLSSASSSTSQTSSPISTPKSGSNSLTSTPKGSPLSRIASGRGGGGVEQDRDRDRDRNRESSGDLKDSPTQSSISRRSSLSSAFSSLKRTLTKSVLDLIPPAFSFSSPSSASPSCLSSPIWTESKFRYDQIYSTLHSVLNQLTAYSTQLDLFQQSSIDIVNSISVLCSDVIEPLEYVELLQQVKAAYAELVLGQREIEEKIEKLNQRIKREIADAIKIDQFDTKKDRDPERDRLDLQTREEEAVIDNLNQTPKGFNRRGSSRANSVASTPIVNAVSVSSGGHARSFSSVASFSAFPASDGCSPTNRDHPDVPHRTFHSLLFSHMQFQFQHRLWILGPILYEFVMIEMLVQKHRQRSFQTIEKVKMKEIQRFETEKTKQGNQINAGNENKKMAKQTNHDSKLPIQPSLGSNPKFPSSSNSESIRATRHRHGSMPSLDCRAKTSIISFDSSSSNSTSPSAASDSNSDSDSDGPASSSNSSRRIRHQVDSAFRYRMGELLEWGARGQTKDLNRAFDCYLQAAAGGYPDAIKKLKDTKFIQSLKSQEKNEMEPMKNKNRDSDKRKDVSSASGIGIGIASSTDLAPGVIRSRSDSNSKEDKDLDRNFEEPVVYRSIGPTLIRAREEFSEGREGESHRNQKGQRNGSGPVKNWRAPNRGRLNSTSTDATSANETNTTMSSSASGTDPDPDLDSESASGDIDLNSWLGSTRESSRRSSAVSSDREVEKDGNRNGNRNRNRFRDSHGIRHGDSNADSESDSD